MNTTDIRLPAESRRAVRYWALFANPEAYRIEDAVRALRVDRWGTAGKDLLRGDRVVIWRGRGSNGRRGVVALGEVTSDPEEADDSANPHWVDPEPSKKKLRVGVRYVVPDGLPIWLDDQEDVLGKLSVSRAKAGTVFKVTENQWSEVVKLAGGWPEAPTDRASSASVAEALHSVIEDGGDEIHVANAESGWFAIAPNKWQELIDRATRVGRAGPSLIVYKTRSDDPRDHYVIPFAVAQKFLTETPKTPKKEGPPRWELSLRVDKLLASRPPREIDVSHYYGAPLPGEIPHDLFDPTSDRVVLDQRVAQLRRVDLKRPIGNPLPRMVANGPSTVFERRPDVKAWVLEQAKGRCELCRSEAPFHGEDGEPFLEVHHVRQLARGGPDTVENAVALCPNCHRRLHHGDDRDERRRGLQGQVDRLTKLDNE